MYGSPRSSRGVLSWPRACLGCGSPNIAEMEKWSFYSRHEEKRSVGYNLIQTTTHTLKADGQVHFCSRCLEYLEKSKKFNMKVQAIKFIIALSTAILIGVASVFFGNSIDIVFAYIYGGIVWSLYFIWQMINPYMGQKQTRFMSADAAPGHQTIRFKFRSPTYGGLFDRLNPSTIQTIDRDMGKTEKSMSDNCCVIPIFLIIAAIIGGLIGGLGAFYNLILTAIVIEVLPKIEPKPGEVPVYTGNLWDGDSSMPYEFGSSDNPSDLEEPYKPPDRGRPEDEFEWG